MSLLRTATLTTVTVLLLGCSGAGPDETEEGASTAPAAGEIVAGACFGGDTLAEADALALIGELDTVAVEAVGDLPAYDDPVGCAEPHGLEVYAVVEAPKGARDYVVALDVRHDDHQQLRTRVAAACREEADPALAAAADASSLDLIPSPGFAGGITTTFVPFPYDAWQRGEKRFACVLRHEEPRRIRYADFRSPDLDPAARVCLDRDLTTVACDTAHTREQLLVLTATPAVAAGDLPGRRAVKEDDGGTYVDLPAAAFRQLDAVCAAYFDRVADEPPEGLTAVAELYPELWGDDAGEFSAVCTVSSPLSVATADMVEIDRSVIG